MPAALPLPLDSAPGPPCPPAGADPATPQSGFLDEISKLLKTDHFTNEKTQG